MFFRFAAVIACVLSIAVLCSSANYKEEFHGKHALVTGGSSGMGFQIALELAQYGAHVVIVARDSNPAWFNGIDAAKRINDDPIVQQSEGSARFVKTDVRDLKQMKALFDDIDKNDGDLDFAVNSAGIPGPNGNLVRTRPFLMGEYDTLRNNLYGSIFSVMYETRYLMKKNHTGAIVSIASMDGLHGTAFGALYSSSKWGIIGLSRGAASGFAVEKTDRPFIRINALAPTLTNTSFTWQQVKDPQEPWEEPYVTPDSDLWKEYGPEWIDEMPCKCIASPKAMADAVLYLLSSDAAYVTGSVLVVARGDLS